MLRRGTLNISYYLIDDIWGFLVNKGTKPLLGLKFGKGGTTFIKGMLTSDDIGTNDILRSFDKTVP